MELARVDSPRYELPRRINDRTICSVLMPVDQEMIVFRISHGGYPPAVYVPSCCLATKWSLSIPGAGDNLNLFS